MFLKAENVFRDFTTTTQPQNINGNVMVDILLMSDIETISCCTNSTHIVENKDEELLANVAANMFTVKLHSSVKPGYLSHKIEH